MLRIFIYLIPQKIARFAPLQLRFTSLHFASLRSASSSSSTTSTSTSMSSPKTKISPTIKLRSRTVDTRTYSPRASRSVLPTAKFIFTTDGRRFPGSSEGSRRAAAHERFLKVVLSPPSATSVKKKNLFGSEDRQLSDVQAALEEIKLREHALADMTNELELSRSPIIPDLMNSREENRVWTRWFRIRSGRL